ncbi:SpaA isopeptide-forming pilin-related protein [Corynebacterium breve]|uniref:SpaA isopeptide-forming pilin-related protein n=1 Tax=Corynebacterium breve TaxID=3049799 RepID=A0ABY8VBU2_9CORY|nr:SpaA isopeptide-forming pilin-related protein [Corynebacterium breve]WIM66899.1 SpaA isopeptide-forming pilin-related protein [Corynebacterium breve]
MAFHDFTGTRKQFREYGKIVSSLALTLFIVFATVYVAAPSNAVPEEAAATDSMSVFDDPSLDAAYEDLMAPEEVASEETAPVEEATSPEIDSPSIDGEAVEPSLLDGEAADPALAELTATEQMMGTMGMVSPMALTTGGNFECTPGKFYAINAQGDVYPVTYASGGFTTSQTSDTRFIPYYSNTQMNGLAIGAGGTTAFAYERTGSSIRVYEWTTGQESISASTATSFTVPATIRGESFGSGKFIAGGTNPVDSSGYYMGGYSTASTTTEKVIKEGYWKDGGTSQQWQSDWRYVWLGYYDYYGYPVYDWRDYGRYVTVENPDVWVPPVVETTTVTQVRFNLYKYDSLSNQTQYVGYVPVYETTGSVAGANGDLAFDQEGNMYILFHDSASTVRLVPVLSETLAEAEVGLGSNDRTANEYYEIKPQESTTLNVTGATGTQFNGLAFNYDGNIIVENSAYGDPPTMRLIDPNTGQVIARTDLPKTFQAWDSYYGYYYTENTWTYGTDLASCTGFPTVELKKDVESRVNEADQFKLEILRASDMTTPKVVGSATTEGTDLGVQDEQAGPVPAVSGKTYRIREVGASEPGSDQPPADLVDYQTTLRCVNTSTNSDVPVTRVAGTMNEWQFTVPTATRFDIPIVSCTYVNASAVTDVEWTKLGETRGGDPTPLRGTTWTLVRKDVAGDKSYTINDCFVEGSTDPKACLAGDVMDVNPAAGEFKLQGLPYGSYELTEATSPEGYKLLKEPVKFELNAQTAASKLLRLPDLLNELDLGELTWTKIDSNGKELSGSEWILTGPNDSGKEIAVTDNTGQSDYEGVDTDPRPGKFKVIDLDLGKYTLEEVKAPDGYIKRTAPVATLEITSTTPSADFGEIENVPNRIDWTKVDSEENSKVLGGSEWSLKKTGSTDTATVIADCVSAGCTGPDLNPTPGEFSLEAVPAGTYDLYESKAPAGYDLDDSVWRLEVMEDGYVLTAADGTSTKGTFTMSGGVALADIGEFENTATTGAVLWQKIGIPYLDQPDTVVLLGESEWELVPVSGDGGEATGDAMTVKDCVADTADGCTGLDKDPIAGQFNVDDLPLGWYRLVETKAPLGFLKDETPRFVQITSEARTFDAGQIKNELVNTQTLPKTGGMGVLPIIAFGSLLMLAGALYGRRQAH